MRNICNKKVAKVAKSSNLYFCELCDYKTSRKANYQKHLNTQKHRKKCNKSVTFCNKKVAKVAKKEYSCKFCGKSFSNRMGLWRHSKKCLGENLDDAVEHDISGEKVLVDKEKFYKELKKERDDFKKRYGDRADEVMHATAMNMAKSKHGLN